MENVFIIFQSGKVRKKFCFGMEKKIMFQISSFDIHFPNILLKIDILLLI